MFRNRSASAHQFSMIPKADIPRSKFNIQKTYKTTFDAGYLIPIYVDEVLPGDTFNVRMTAFARLATPIFPIMDNIVMESFFFFVPNRLVWNNWARFMGEQDNPNDSTSYLVPTMYSPDGGYPVNSIFDYMGLPTAGQVSPGFDVFNISLPLRAYNLIWNQWFRDENLQDSVKVNKGDTADLWTDYTLLRRGKRHDYFTSCLPFVQKGPAVTLPLGISAPVLPVTDTTSPSFNIAGNYRSLAGETSGASEVKWNTAVPTSGPAWWDVPGLFADLSSATAATINQIRQAFQIQKLLERDARGGTRYTEIVRSHFGVLSPDARLQRPEYLGGGKTNVNIHPIAQTSRTDADETPLGTLAATGTLTAHGHGFSQAFVEHGYVIGLLAIRADLTYQQGIRKLWLRQSKYDFYWPVFSHLGEQAVQNREIYYTGNPGPDGGTFGYQERWAEYRYNPSQITGLFRSTSPGTLDAWHLSQRFLTVPTLNETFIQDNPPMERILAVGSEALGQQFIFDAFFDIKAARPMPMYSVPGLVDHF